MASVTIALPVCQWCDHKSRCVPKVLIRILELGIADVGKTVLLGLIPAVPQLAEPGEGLGILSLLLDQLAHHVTSVHIDGTDGHDLLTVATGEVA